MKHSAGQYSWAHSIPMVPTHCNYSRSTQYNQEKSLTNRHQMIWDQNVMRESLGYTKRC